MKIWRKGIYFILSMAILLSLILPGGAGFSTAAEQTGSFAEDFQNPKGTARSAIRWWVSIPNMTEAETRREVRMMAEAGFGMIEVCELSGGTLGSNQFRTAMKWALDEALKCGIQLDFAVSTGATITFPDKRSPDKDYELSEQGLFCAPVDFTAAAGSMNYDVEGFLTPERILDGTTEKGFEPNRLYKIVAVTAAKKNADGTYDLATAQDITDQANIPDDSDAATASISWTAPAEGNWVIFYHYQQATAIELFYYGSYDMTSVIVDHQSDVAIKTMLDEYWGRLMEEDPEFKDMMMRNGGNFFGDSLELGSAVMAGGKRNFTNWTWDLLEAFEERWGYDLTPYLPVIYRDDFYPCYGGSNTIDADPKYNFGSTGRNVCNDFWQTLTELFAVEHVEAIREWADQYNMGIRYQVYGNIFDLTLPALNATVVETESLYAGDRRDMYRTLSGAVHMNGSGVYSTESAPISGYGWAQSWTGTNLISGAASNDRGLIYHMNRQFATGVNQANLHGFTYRYGTSWPGNSTMNTSGAFSNEWDDKTPMWEHIDLTVGYLNRVQHVLQQGQADIDLAVYHKFNKETRGLFSSDLNAIEEAGYTYDFASPDLLRMEKAVVSTVDGKKALAAGGPSYKALVIDQRQRSGGGSGLIASDMPVDTAETILEYAEAGLPIVIVGDAPSRVYSFYGSEAAMEEAEARLAEIMEEIAGLPTTETVATKDDVPAALERLNVLPDVQDGPDEMINFHRTDTDAEYYYLYNTSLTNSISGIATLKGEGTPYLLNPWSGEITPIAKYTAGNGTVTVDVDLGPNDTMLVAIARDSWTGASPADLHVTRTNADAVVYTEDNQPAIRTAKRGIYNVEMSDDSSAQIWINSDAQEAFNLTDWTLEVESWAAGATVFDTVKTNVGPIQLNELVPWDQISGVGLVGGVAAYTTSFTLSKGWKEGQGALLNLERVSDTMRLFVNGNQVSVNQITNQADIGPYLKKGNNDILIEVVSNLANIKSVRGTRHQFGIIGDVIVTPYIQTAYTPNDSSYVIYEEFDSNIRYDGAWSNTDSMSFSQKRAKKSTTVGNSAAFTFEGRAFQLVSYKSASQGIIQISVDGEIVDTVDLYDTGYDTAFGTIAYDSPLLLPGKHTVSISIVGKNSKATASGFYLDAINVAGTLVPVEPVISDSVYQMSDANAATVVTLPAGTDIQITGEPTGGTAVAGNGKIVYTPTSMAAEDSITYQVGDQTATVTIQKAAVTRYEESFAGYEKTGTWPSFNVASYSGGSAYRSNVKDSTISFTFEGTGFDVISYKSFTRGTFQVKVEDSSGNTVVDKEVDCWDPGADTLFQYPVYKSGTLAKDTYKVTITVLQNKNVEFDGVDIYK